jgi:putative nucleotidyltransferase with HDIG domain
MDVGGIETPELGQLAKLSPFRPVVIRLLQLFDRDDVSLAEITELVQSDPEISSELLAFVNSPFFGVSEVWDLGHAVRMLGIERTNSLVSTLAMRVMMASAPKTPVVRRFWMHSVATAAIAQAMAPEFRVAPELSHTAAIIHDLGRMGLLAAHTTEYAAFALRAHESVDAILAAEQEQFGMDHCHAGLLLAKAWGLPRVYHGTVSRHHEAVVARGAGVKGDVRSLVQLSCLLADDFMFQAILHRSPRRPHETIRLHATENMCDALVGRLAAMEGRVIETIQARDF